MATKNIVPRSSGEGTLGSSSKLWKEVHHITSSFGDISLIEDASNRLQLSGGPLVAASGLSGSLTQLSNGSSYLVEGSNISITTGSSGQVTIASTFSGVIEDLSALGAPSSDGQLIVATGAGAFAYESGATARTSLGLGTGDSPTFTGLTLSGDLTVNGTTTTVNTDNLLVEDPVVLLGYGASAANTNGGLAILSGSSVSGESLVIGRVANDTWGVGRKDVTGGTVTTLADMTLVDFKAAGITASSLTLGSTAITSTAAELNLLDGGTAVGGSITVADTDGIIINDNGTMKTIPALDLKTYSSAGISSAADDITAGDAAVNISTTTGNITLDTDDGDIILDPAGKDVIFKVTGSDYLKFTMDGDDTVISGSKQDGDLVFSFNGSEYLRMGTAVDGSVNGLALTSGNDLFLKSGASVKFDYAYGDQSIAPSSTYGFGLQSEGAIIKLTRYGNVFLRDKYSLNGEKQAIFLQAHGGKIDFLKGGNNSTGGPYTYNQLAPLDVSTQSDRDRMLLISGSFASDNSIITHFNVGDLGTTSAIELSGSGEIIKLGQDSPSSGEFLKWDGTKVVWDSVASSAADDITTGDAAITITTTSGNVTVKSAPSSNLILSGSTLTSIDADTAVNIKGGGNTAIAINSSGNITQLGPDTSPNANEYLVWNGTSPVWEPWSGFKYNRVTSGTSSTATLGNHYSFDFTQISASYTLNLPNVSASNAGKEIRIIIKTHHAGSSLTIQPDSGDTLLDVDSGGSINNLSLDVNDASLVGTSFLLVSDGTDQWEIL